MAQIKYGIRTILEFPFVYTSFQYLLGAKKTRQVVINDFLRLEPGMSLLDVGCGPGDYLSQIKTTDIDYIGFDMQSEYIESAIKKFPNRGKFVCSNVNDYNFSGKKFDRILISCLLHHLEDQEVDQLLHSLKKNS